MTDTFDQQLQAARDVIDAAGLVPTLQLKAQNANLYRLPVGSWNAIYTRCQRLDMRQVWGAVGAARINNDDWNLYWADNGTTKELLLIGRWAGEPEQFQDYFGWIISQTDKAILDGNWDNPQGRNTTVDMNFQGNLTDDHKNKHFGGEPAAAQFTIGTVQTRKRIVAGMEEKAIAEGLNLAGEAFFWFSVVVGTDGQRPQQQTHSIRVDTPGIPSQHSHPIPENQPGMVSHDGKVKTAIREATTARDLSRLLGLAKYLKVIGAANNQYSNLRADAHLYGNLRPPTCIYWSW